MPTITIGKRDGIARENTCISIPTDLKTFARTQKISMSEVLRQGLEDLKTEHESMEEK